MSEDKQTAESPKKQGGPSPVLTIILPTILAGAGAFGGVKAAGTHHEKPAQVEHEVEISPPGPTVTLDAFLVTLDDAEHKTHPMKIVLAVEFGSKAKEEAVKALVPRIRDAVLSFLRTLTFEEASDAAHMDKARKEILEKIREAGGTAAERLLITDLVIQ